MAPSKSAKKAKSTRATPTDVTCEGCGKNFAARGIVNHRRTCGKSSVADKRSERSMQELAASEKRRQNDAIRVATTGGNCASEPGQTAGDSRHHQMLSGPLGHEDDVEVDVEVSNSFQRSPQSSPRRPRRQSSPMQQDAAVAQQPSIDDVRVEYHPSSALPEQHFTYENFDSKRPKSQFRPSVDPEAEPWRPFRTRLDFEIAEFIHGAHLNSPQIDTLLDLIQQSVDNPKSFTLTNDQSLKKLWELARERIVAFQEVEISAPYQQEELHYNAWIRPLWDWCTELLRDPNLIYEFRWDAEKQFKYNGETYKRFFDEPWTADAWWRAQSNLPPNGKPFGIILYADKTQLSSFGGAKGYPVIARCANLPVEIRNSEKIGGGILVGWLPVVKEETDKSGAKDFVNLKRVVWHKAFYALLESIRTWAKTGYSIECADNIWRLIFPIVFILSADYEEQCIMAAIRGLRSLFPCPVCLVPNEKLSDLSEVFPLRTTGEMKNVYDESQELSNADKEELLKSYGLRDVENVFWGLEHSDVYAALSWDRLHAYHGGLFKHHLWKEFKEILESETRGGTNMVNEQFGNIPPYRGLNHFSEVMKLDHADGTKYEDVSKILVYASHNVLSRDISEKGYHLLKIIRSYLELDMYASLTVHTEDTIASGRMELQTFSALVKEYIDQFDSDKNWNFPKAHTHIHLFDDIQNKGVTKNYNTKPNEKKHRPLKKFYLRQSNFKEVDGQILKLDANSLVALIIRRDIDILDANLSTSEDKTNSNEELHDIHQSETPTTMALTTAENDSDIHHIVVGSPLSEISLAKTESAQSANPAFTNLRNKITIAMTRYLNRPVKLNPNHMIKPYRYLKVNYESVIDSRIRTDYLRINPSWNGKPRYDYVLMQATDTTCIFAQLLHVFAITIFDKTYHLALILPMDRKLSLQNRPRDRDLRFTRVCARPKSKAVVVDTETIIRGALLVPDPSGIYGDEKIVMEVVDEDLWMRIRTTVTLDHDVSL